MINEKCFTFQVKRDELPYEQSNMDKNEKGCRFLLAQTSSSTRKKNALIWQFVRSVGWQSFAFFEHHPVDQFQCFQHSGNQINNSVCKHSERAKQNEKQELQRKINSISKTVIHIDWVIYQDAAYPLGGNIRSFLSISAPLCTSKLFGACAIFGMAR